MGGNSKSQKEMTWILKQTSQTKVSKDYLEEANPSLDLECGHRTPFLAPENSGESSSYVLL